MFDVPNLSCKLCRFAFYIYIYICIIFIYMQWLTSKEFCPECLVFCCLKLWDNLDERLSTLKKVLLRFPSILDTCAGRFSFNLVSYIS